MTDLGVENVPESPPVLRGWLILIFIALLLGMGINLISFYASIFGPGEGDSAFSLWQQGQFSNMPRMFLVAVLFDVVSPIVMVSYGGWLFFLFFKKSRRFPFALFSGSALALLILLLERGIFAIAGLPMGDVAGHGVGITGAVAGYQYLITQRRPKETFVH